MSRWMRGVSSGFLGALAGAAMLWLPSNSAGQLLQPEQPPATPNPPTTREVRIEDLPGPMRLGARVETVRQRWPNIPVVVIVPDGRSYLEAVAAWSPRGRYPVLIDDGSRQAREDIARFVRGFAPRQVVRWKAAAASPAKVTREAIEKALYRSWSMAMPQENPPPVVNSAATLIARWKQMSIVPPGVVVTDADDSAWPAALALAAGRTQPLIWARAEGGINATMSLEQFKGLATAIERGCTELGLTWRELGDEIESVTLCLNAPVKVQGPEGVPLALTDLVARHEAEGDRTKGKRWGWSGQIYGTEAQAAYRAMSALFLLPQRAWLFDGYPSSEPWNTYDATKAAENLKQVGVTVTVEDSPKQSAHHWREVAGTVLNAGFIAVNTKGNADEFNLEPGRARPGDVPILNVPAYIYFVHSFSAAVPGERTTVAGRWMERGAYAYAGSVHEPYLHAFVPTPVLTARLASSFAWGAAVRIDDAPAWKVATIGDPLITHGPPAPRVDVPLPLEGWVDLQVELAAAVKEKRFQAAVEALVALGRDADAVKLVSAVRREAPESFTADLAAVAVLPAFRADDWEVLIAAMERLSPEQASGDLRDALWLAANKRTGKLEEPQLKVLERHLRDDQIGSDAAELARNIAVKVGRREAAALINSVRERARTEYDRVEIEDALRRYGIRK